VAARLGLLGVDPAPAKLAGPAVRPKPVVLRSLKVPGRLLLVTSQIRLPWKKCQGRLRNAGRGMASARREPPLTDPESNIDGPAVLQPWVVIFLAAFGVSIWGVFWVTLATMPALRTALEWIAFNDDPGELDPEAVASTLTLGMVGDLWEKDRAELARKVVRMRRAAAREAKRR